MTSTWHHIESGAGRPLILLHGIGMSKAAWAPVMPILAARRRVIAFDIPGFGRTPPLPAGTPQTHDTLAVSLAQTLSALGVEGPVDLVGNSMGGQLALVAARQGLARSVVALSPGGLWRGDHPPPLPRYTLRATRLSLSRLPGLSERLLSTRIGRTLALAVPMTSRGWRLSADEAVQMARTFRGATAFDEMLDNTRQFTGGQDIRVPVTVAFGTRDWLLRANCQYRDELPPQTRWLAPRGWGHVPMWDDPEGVATLILDGSA